MIGEIANLDFSLTLKIVFRSLIILLIINVLHDFSAEFGTFPEIDPKDPISAGSGDRNDMF